MSISLKVASSLELLASDIVENMSTDQLGWTDKQQVITQTEGINNWLKYRIAQRNGIAANIEFIKMNDVVMMLYKELCPEGPKLIERDMMVWHIFSILETDGFKTLYPDKASYYAGNEVKRAALAEEMADLFDQYQIYRDKDILDWNNILPPASDEFAWQAFLWREMKVRMGKNYADRPEISSMLISAIKDERMRPVLLNRFPRLRFFGLAILTPYYLHLFYTLSEYIEVEFYLTNPSPEILWMDNISEEKITALRKRPELLRYKDLGNELLINWANVLKNTFQLLVAHEPYVNLYDVIESAPEPEEGASLLQQVQYEIRANLANEQRGKYVIDPAENDDSLSVHGCYTPEREVEVLYNFLLRKLSENSGTGARDILVMVNNMDRYAPIIKAVFENSPVNIPYTIADESLTSGNTLFSALHEILSVDMDAFTSEQVLSLLDNTCIRERFGFEDIAEVRQAVREANIFFGTSQNVRDPERWSRSEAWMVSWEYGLKKMMYGLCMSGEAYYDDTPNGFYPLDTAEGYRMAERIKLVYFIDTLKKQLRFREETCTLGEWAQYLLNLAEAMVLDPEDTEDEDYPRFIKLIDKITGLEKAADEKISFATFRYIFLHQLSQEKRNSQFGNKGITFCSLLPMRSVPYDIIAMLGMDFSQFPRSDNMLSFSLLSGSSVTGDRSIRENDKHLMLETILSAKKFLYISFLARNEKKGTELPPSILVDELIYYLAKGFGEDPEKFKKKFITIHPLHLFSKKYLNRASGLYNYLWNGFMKGNPLTLRDAPAEQEKVTDFSTIPLMVFADFFKHPMKKFLNTAYKIYYFDENERLPEHEVFEVDTFDAWQLKTELLGGQVSDPDRKKKQGVLPLSNMGLVSFEMIRDEVALFDQKMKAITGDREPLEIEICLPDQTGTIITGKLSSVFGHTYVGFCFSKSVLKNIMPAWVNYLVALTQPVSPALDFAFLYLDTYKKPVSISVAYNMIDMTKVKQLVSDMISVYKTSASDMLLFYPPLAKLIFKKKDEEIEILRKEFENQLNETNFDKTFSDPYLLKMVDNGLLEEENLLQVKENTLQLMSLLHEYAPGIFK